MRTTIRVDDHTFEELMEIAETDSRTEAVNRAIHAFIRHERLRRFRRLRGELRDLPSNDELETLDLERLSELMGDDE